MIQTVSTNIGKHITVRPRPISTQLKVGRTFLNQQIFYRFMSNGMNMISITPNLYISHGCGEKHEDIKHVFPNPYPHKQYGGEKSIALFKAHLFDNPEKLMDLLKLDGMELTCGCSHRKCYSSMVVDLLNDLQTKKPNTFIIHKSIQVCGQIKITSFGHEQKVKNKIDEELSDIPEDLFEVTRDEIYNGYRLIEIFVIQMFGSIV